MVSVTGVYRVLAPVFLSWVVGLSALTRSAGAEASAIPCSDQEVVRYTAQRTLKGPVVDGRLDEAVWQNATWSERYVDILTGGRAIHDTRVALVWDDENLYFGIRIEEPFVRGQFTANNSPIYQENDVEVFIAGADSYYEFEINARNTTYEVFFLWEEAWERAGFSKWPEFARTNLQFFNGVGFQTHPRGRRLGHFNWHFPKMQTAVFVDGTLNDDTDRDRGWTVELAFPWAGMKSLATDGRALPPKEGDEWRIDLSRFNQYKEAPPAQDSGGWVLSPHRVWDSHIPECFPRVRFSTNPVPVGAGAGTQPALQVTSPANRLVFQRNSANRAAIPVVGRARHTGAAVEARLLPVNDLAGRPPWTPLGTVQSDGTFHGQLVAPGGWYGLEVQTQAVGGGTDRAMVERVGVGEVFVVVGHSVAQGGDINLPGATDDRVNTIALRADDPSRQRDYERTGQSRFLPEVVGCAFTNGVVPAPFGHGTYFWARFAEHVVQTQNVPVLVLNAAFGGTSLEHWAKSARGESFEHSFVKSGIRMPYANLANALQRYIAVTGVRAVLADQGQNDWPEPSADIVFQRYRTWIEQARIDLGFPKLAVVVNRQTPFGDKIAIRQAQDRVIREVPNCFPGPDYDLLQASGFSDRIHLNEAGAGKAAQLWAAALDTSFFAQSAPYVSER